MFKMAIHHGQSLHCTALWEFVIISRKGTKDIQGLTPGEVQDI